MPQLRFNWSVKWPDEPGTYLFYGVPKGIVRTRGHFDVVVAAMSSNQRLTYLGAGDILYPEEWEGVWAPFDLEEPDVEKLLSEASG